MEKRTYTLGFLQANLYALALFIPIVGVYLLPYGWIYGWKTLTIDLSAYFLNIPLFAASVLVGTIFHEILHALCWSWFDNISWSKILFGFKWKSLTPYVHCAEPVGVRNYRWGVAMPGLILGVLPYIIALLLQQGWWLGFSLFFTLAAGGDILILLLLWNVEAGTRVQDHPDLVGCKVFTPMEV